MSVFSSVGTCESHSVNICGLWEPQAILSSLSRFASGSSSKDYTKFKLTLLVIISMYQFGSLIVGISEKDVVLVPFSLSCVQGANQSESRLLRSVLFFLRSV
jgi:hypothetical protein